MSNIIVCVVIVIIITIIFLYTYYVQECQHQFQLEKIRTLEHKYEMKKQELAVLASLTQKCPVPNLNDPRSCYFGSNYQCSWNDQIGRCDVI
jgi:hypothetical protein